MAKKDSLHITESGETVQSWIAILKDAEKPQYENTTLLETLLRLAFQDTQERVHVDTQSLKSSGKTSSDFDGDVWTGTITYGGVLWKVPSPGPPNDPVDYAIYEMARGGEHDFFSGLPFFEAQIEEIINEAFPG